MGCFGISLISSRSRARNRRWLTFRSLKFELRKRNTKNTIDFRWCSWCSRKTHLHPATCLQRQLTGLLGHPAQRYEETQQFGKDVCRTIFVFTRILAPELRRTNSEFLRLFPALVPPPQVSEKKDGAPPCASLPGWLDRSPSWN